LVKTFALCILCVLSGPFATGGAVFLDNTDDRLYAPDANTLDITTAITISAWVRQRTTNEAAGASGVIAKGREALSTAANYQLRFNRTRTNLLEFYFHATSFQQAVAHNMSGTGHPTFFNLTNDWVHIAVTHAYGSPASTRFYWNGVEYTNKWIAGTGTGTPAANTEKLIIGQDFAGGGYFSGEIEEVAIWGAQLTADEVKRLSAAVKYTPLHVRPDALRGYWPLNDHIPFTTAASPQTWRDYSGNRNHLIPTNSPQHRPQALPGP
jgi:large repetitive protein